MVPRKLSVNCSAPSSTADNAPFTAPSRIEAFLKLDHQNSAAASFKFVSPKVVLLTNKVSVGANFGANSGGIGSGGGGRYDYLKKKDKKVNIENVIRKFKSQNNGFTSASASASANVSASASAGVSGWHSRGGFQQQKKKCSIRNGNLSGGEQSFKSFLKTREKKNLFG